MTIATGTQGRRRFSSDEVERMVAVGILGEDEPLELLDGELIVLSPQNPLHAALTEKIRRLLERAYGPGFHCRTHSPLAADPQSLPEPDVGLYRGDVEAYLDRHPGGSDAVLVVEVASTSQGPDRAKAGVYARARVPVYWLVDMPRRRVELRLDPQDRGEYRQLQVLGPNDRVTLPTLGEAIPVADLLP